MSNKATLQELYDVCINLVDEDNLTDFTKLANRAVKRLYSKAATSGDTVLYHMEVTTAADHVDDSVEAIAEQPATSVFTFTENVSVFDLSLIQIGGDTALDLTDTSSRDDENVINYSDVEFGSNCIQTLNFHFTPSVAATALYEYINGLPSSNPDVNWTAQTANAFVTASIDGTSVTVTAIENGAAGNDILTRSSVSDGSWSSDETSGGADEVPAVPSSPHEHMPKYSVILPAEYSHAKKFKISEGFDKDHATNFNYTPSGRSESIIPMESTFDNSGYDYDAFVDYGEIGGVRVYGLPNWMSVKVDEGGADFSVWGLLRKAYNPVSEASDLLPFESVPAMKLAVLGTVYEDENDLERGLSYWKQAIQELESESQTYRGPQKMNISFEDEAAYDVVDTMN